MERLTVKSVEGSKSKASYRVSFDVGGTFTDFTLLNEADGSLKFFKLPSTPADPSVAIHAGIATLIETYGLQPADIGHVGHGTTVATNMVIERRGAKTALLVTRGFRDVLEIGRQTRPSLYDYNTTKPTPLVPRALRLEVTERVDATGSVLIPLSEDEILDIVKVLKAQEVTSVAICYMHSYRNKSHELRTKEILQQYLPDVYVSASADILPEFREYERMSTTVLNAYVGPRMANYMSNLVRSVKSMEVPAVPNTVHSNGGLMSVEAVLTAPVRTCVSGPAAGVIGAAEIGKIVGVKNLITFDVGGTSTDVSLITDLKPRYTSGRLVADYPAKTQMIDVHVIGAGGGSIAQIDDAGAMTVGPRSAGAVPGPIAYGRGGTVVTLTDAQVVLGRLNPVSLLDGRMKIFSEEAREAMREQIAVPLGLSVEEAAYGILRIANANMARAVRSVSTERGFNVQDFSLCAFGGAGGLHAAELAKDCGITQILVPQEPGTMCARGILLSNISMDFVRTLMAVVSDSSWPEVQAAFADLHAEGEQWLTGEKIDNDQRRISTSIEARYRGQNFEIVVPLDGLELPAVDVFAENFRRAHIQEYGYDAHDRDIEIVNCRLIATGVVPHAPLNPIDGGDDVSGAINNVRPVYFGETGWHDTPVYTRSKLPVGVDIDGPAIVEEMSSTTVVIPTQTFRADAYGNLLITDR